MGHDLSLGFATKGNGLRRCGPIVKLGITFHAHGSVGECEGMNPHTLKYTPTLGVGVPVEFRIFKTQL